MDSSTQASRTDVTVQFVVKTLEEAEAMARHALEHGMNVPPEVVGALTGIRQHVFPGLTTSDSSASDGSVQKSAGISPETSSLPTGVVEGVSRLAELHQKLARLVAPAKPHCLWQLSQCRKTKTWFAWLGPVPLLRQLMGLAVLFLAGLLGLSLNQAVNSTNLSKAFLGNFGSAQLLCQSFLLCAAGLGACFAALFRAGRTVEAGTYDSRFDSSYYCRLVLGLMSGIMLAELVGPQFIDSSNSPELGAAATQAFAKPTLALLGGFSATVVHRVLERLVQAVESLVAGDAEADVEAKAAALRIRAQAELAEEKMKVAGKLTRLGTQSDVSDTTKQAMSQLVNELLGSHDTQSNSSSLVTCADPHKPVPSEPQEGSTVIVDNPNVGFAYVTPSSEEGAAQCVRTEALA